MITVTTKMMIPCSSIYRTQSFTKKPRNIGISHSHSFQILLAIAKAPVIHAASQVHSSRQLGNAAGARLMSRQVRDGCVTDVTGAKMIQDGGSGHWGIPSGELTFCHGKSPCLMGKSTISMAIFNSKLLVHQRVLGILGIGYGWTNHQIGPIRNSMRLINCSAAHNRM